MERGSTSAILVVLPVLSPGLKGTKMKRLLTLMLILVSPIVWGAPSLFETLDVYAVYNGSNIASQAFSDALGIMGIDHGGTNATTAANARISLGVDASGTLLVASGGTNLVVRCKVLSGVTAGAEGSSTPIAHGTTAEKIIAYHAKVEIAANIFLEPEYTRVAEYQFSIQHDDTNFNIQLAATNSGNILGKRVIITVWYVE